jgi:hypothetical protein
MTVAVTINVNKLSLCHKGSGGITIATLPDVCLTPPGIPVPYPNVAFSKDLAQGTTTVFADGGNSCAIAPSIFATSSGDEPGTMGGVVSGTFTKEASFLTFSADVKIEGQAACRLTDKMLQNHGNTVDCAGVQQPPVFGNKIKCDAVTCADAWKAAKAETDKIVNMKDPFERNKVISAKYAEMYENNKELSWPGVAAFASKQVGCGMAEARDSGVKSVAIGAGIGAGGGAAGGAVAGAAIGVWFFGVGALPAAGVGALIGGGLGLLGGGAAGYAGSKEMISYLAKGNGAVFSEIYPVLALYDFYKKNCTPEALRACMNELGDGNVPPLVRQGMNDVLNGDSTEGALKMLQQEQQNTLQHAVYDDALFDRLLDANKILGISAVQVAYSADCTADADLTRTFSGGNLYNYGDRWHYAQGVVTGFGDLNSQNPGYVDQQLNNIISRGGGP